MGKKLKVKAETFVEYLRRVGSDHRASAIDRDSPTAEDYENAANRIGILEQALEARDAEISRLERRLQAIRELT